MIQDLLFSTPWWLLILLIGGGGFVWYTGNTRSEKSWQVAGIVVALLGVALALTSWLVTTDKERVEMRSRQMIQALNRRDWPALQGLLDPHTSLEGVYTNREQIVAGAKKTVDAIGLSSASITQIQARQTQTLITVDMNVLSSQDMTYGRPTVTSWRFNWSNTGTGWKLVRIEPLPNEQISKDEVVRHLERP